VASAGRATGAAKALARAKAGGKLHGAGNCGTGRGGFKPGNTCGKGGRAKLAADIAAGRAGAKGPAQRAALRAKVRELKAHRRGKAGAVSDATAGEHRAALRAIGAGRASMIGPAPRPAKVTPGPKPKPAPEPKGDAATADDLLAHHRGLIAEAAREQAAGHAAGKAARKPADAAALKAHAEALQSQLDHADADITRLARRTSPWEAAAARGGAIDIGSPQGQAYLGARKELEGVRARRRDLNEQHREARARLKAAEAEAHLASVPHHVPHGAPIGERIAANRVAEARRRAVIALQEHHDDARTRARAAFDAHVADLHRLGAERYALEGRKKPSQEDRARIKGLTAAQKEAAARATAASEELAARGAAHRERLFSVLRADRPTAVKLGEVEADRAAFSPRMRSQLDEGAAFVGRLTQATDHPHLTVDARRIPDAEAPRAHHQDFGDRSRVSHTDHDDVATVVHELGHALEARLAGVGDRAREFLAHRVGSEAPRPMNELTGSSRYRPDERGREDKFGAVFGDHAGYVGKDYGGRASEIMSMGIEQLHRDPARFAKDDPEYFRFVAGILDGSLR
jgi:hypothetical protein